MTQGFVVVAPDGTGKSIDNDVVLVPPGTIITDNLGVQTVLQAPQYYFRQRTIVSDPSNPLGVAGVTGGVGPPTGAMGLTVHTPMGQAGDNAMIAILMDMATNLAALAGNPPLAAINAVQQAIDLSLPIVGRLPPPSATPNAAIPSISDKFGRDIFIPHTIRDLVMSFEATITTTGETAISPLSIGDPSTVYDLVALLATNTSTTGVYLTIRDQFSTVTGLVSNNSPMYLSAPANDTRGLALGGVIVPQTNPGQQWTATLSGATTDVRVWALFAKNQR